MNKNVLIISEVPTHKPYAGNRSCILSYSEMLKDMGYTVYFLLYYGKGFDVEDVNLTKIYWAENYFEYKMRFVSPLKRRVLSFFRFKLFKTNFFLIDDFYPSGLECAVKKILVQKEINIVITNYIWTTKLFTKIKGIRKILYTHDVFSNRFERTGMDFFSTSPNEEAKALNRCDAIISIQETESLYFRYITNKPVICGFSPVKLTKLPINLNKNILFLAGSNPLNINGITDFIRNVLPDLLYFDSEITLLIGGRICSDLNHLETLNVRLLGDVELLEEFYQLGDISVNPVKQGTGLKIKTIEALSFGKALVCHPHSKEGLFDEMNIPIIEAYSNEEFVSALISLFKSKEKVIEYHNRSIQYIEAYNIQVRSMFHKALSLNIQNE
jgi:glycosyltransferase involved in cell wall biosynthesis